MAQPFIKYTPTADNYWRAIVLFGRNVATYKFALAQALLELRPASGQLVTLEELAALEVRTSQYNPGGEIPERNWLYRLAKRYWFNDFGVYRGHDHSRTAAPALVRSV